MKINLEEKGAYFDLGSRRDRVHCYRKGMTTVKETGGGSRKLADHIPHPYTRSSERENEVEQGYTTSGPMPYDVPLARLRLLKIL